MLLLHVSASADHLQGDNLKRNTDITHAVKTCVCMDLEYSVIALYNILQLLYMDMITVLYCYNILYRVFLFAFLYYKIGSITLVDLFESYDDARSCESQCHSTCFGRSFRPSSRV
jgi:hypothetical protein